MKSVVAVDTDCSTPTEILTFALVARCCQYDHNLQTSWRLHLQSFDPHVPVPESIAHRHYDVAGQGQGGGAVAGSRQIWFLRRCGGCG